MGSTLPWTFEKLITMAQLGAKVNKSSEAARKWARRHQVLCTALRKAGRVWLIDERAVDRVLLQDAQESVRKAG